MTYTVKEIFYTLQGEGQRAGRAAVFCRFAGCNLWSGRAMDRAKSACPFCDTDFVGINGTLGGKYPHAQALASQIASCWMTTHERRYVVLTGGEPLLQVDQLLIEALHAEGFEIAVETNGTLPCPDGIDWLCVSPKDPDRWVQRTGNELKLLYPLPQLKPDTLPSTHFTHYLLQPIDDANQQKHLQDALAYCLAHPQWQLSLQTHKILNIR